MNGSERGKKRARTVESGNAGEDGKSTDVKLCDPALRKLAHGHGQLYVKEPQLERALLLRYLKEKGDIREVQLIGVKVRRMGGEVYEMKAEEKSSVGELRAKVSDRGESRYPSIRSAFVSDGQKQSEEGEGRRRAGQKQHGAFIG